MPYQANCELLLIAVADKRSASPIFRVKNSIES